MGGVLVASATAVWRDYLYGRVTSFVVNNLRLQMFKHLQRLSMSYYSGARAGDVITRFSGDLADARDAILLRSPRPSRRQRPRGQRHPWSSSSTGGWRW